MYGFLIFPLFPTAAIDSFVDIYNATHEGLEAIGCGS